MSYECYLFVIITFLKLLRSVNFLTIIFSEIYYNTIEYIDKKIIIFMYSFTILLHPGCGLKKHGTYNTYFKQKVNVYIKVPQLVNENIES